MRARIAIVALSLAAACRDRSLTWERMVTQPRVDLYSETPALPDGRSMRLPPAGTVPHTIALPELVREGAQGGLLATEIPVEQTRATLAEGRRQFGVHCAPCHGAAGDRRSYVAGFMTLKPPATLIAPPVSGYPPGLVFQRISLGFGYMRSYQEIAVADRWAIVQYVRWLQSSRGAQEGVHP